jgi:DNA-binding NarL/FixJ family response regulator
MPHRKWPEVILRSFLIVDDHPLYSEGLAREVRKIFPQSQTMTAKSLIDADKIIAERGVPQFAFLDLAMGGTLDQVEGVQYFARKYTETKVAVVSGNVSRSVQKSVFAAGATGFIEKGIDIDSQLMAIQVFVNNGFFAPSGIFNSTVANPLSRREQEILQFMESDISYAAIGQKLNIAESTVKNHTQQIYQKLGIHGRSDVVKAARERGLI